MRLDAERPAAGNIGPLHQNQEQTAIWKVQLRLALELASLSRSIRHTRSDVQRGYVSKAKNRWPPIERGEKQCRWTIRSDLLSSPTFLTQHPKGTLCPLAYNCSWPRTLTSSATHNIEQIDESRRRQTAIGPPISIINVKTRLNIAVFFRRYFSNR